jgi:DNA-binding beta-propeller fold protein YncE
MRYLVTLALLHMASAARAQPPGPTYWQDIRPILRKNCTVCHSAKNLKEEDVSGGLALDSYEAVRKGSALRPIFQPGKSDGSVILKLLETTNKRRRMPLDAPPLGKKDIALIRRWIDTGAREGKKPNDEAATLITKRPAKTRKLDVILPTTTVAPPGTLAKAGGKLDLALKVGPLAPVTAVTFSPDNKLLVSGAYGQVVVWDLTTVKLLRFLTNVLGAVNDVRFSPDGKLLAVAGGQPSAKGDLRLYHVGEWKLLGVLRGHDDVVFSVAFSPDGRYLASASFDKTVRVWNVGRIFNPSTDNQVTTEQVHTGHSDFVYSVAFSPDGKYLVSASKDRTVKMVETLTGKSAFTFSGMNEDVLAVAFSPDGKQVVSSGFEATLHWWSPQTGERSRLQGGHGIATNELAFSQDGSRLISAGSDTTVRIWNPATAALVRSIGVGSIVYTVAISPDNKRIASGSFDGLVRLWDEASGRLLLTLLTLPAANNEHDWLTLAPPGYAVGSAGIAALGHWRVDGQDVAPAPVWQAVRQPEMLVRAARAENMPAPAFTAVNRQATKSATQNQKK